MSEVIFSRCGMRCDQCLICKMYPCNIFPAEPSEEVLVQKIEIEKQWTWEDEELMAAYTCKKNMDAFRKEHDEKYPMDLHDFQDVAQNYDLYLDVMYREHDNYEGFQEFYLELAREYGGKGTIDIACGTGAVLLYLAEHGIDIDGTDLSEAMCEVAKGKAESKGLHLNVFPANMTEFQSDRKYSLAIIARSGFMHLLTPELQRKALLNIRDHLTEDGILTLNTFAPYPPFQAQQMKTSENDYTYRLEYINHEGNREKIYNAISYDPLTQIMSGNWKFETYNDAGNKIAERIRPLKMRQTYRQELLYLIELCGLEVVQIYGNYYKSTEETGNYIWVLKKKA